MSGNDSLSQASSPSIITSSASKAFWINMDFSSWYVRQWFIVSSVFPQHHYQFCFRGRMMAWWLTTAGVSILSEWSLCHCILCKLPATHRGTRTSLALLFMACPAWFIVPSVFPQYHGSLCFRGRIMTWQVTTAGVSILSEWSLCHCILCKPLATHRGTTMLHCVFDTFVTNPDNFPRIRSDFSMVTHGEMAPMTPLCWCFQHLPHRRNFWARAHHQAHRRQPHEKHLDLGHHQGRRQRLQRLLHHRKPSSGLCRLACGWFLAIGGRRLQRVRILILHPAHQKVHRKSEQT